MEETPDKPKKNYLRLANHGLTLIAMTLGIYVIFMPFLPMAGWWVSKNTPVKVYAINSEAVRQEAEKPVSDENRLYIESLGMNEQIHTGGLEQLRNGVLHRGHTSTPDKGSNTVLVGHRFTYDGNGVFYHLDKVKENETITLHWEGKRYDYVVSNIRVVPPEEIAVEAPTEEDVLTLYTCTPLWSAKNRLVIRANLIEGEI